MRNEPSAKETRLREKAAKNRRAGKIFGLAFLVFVALAIVMFFLSSPWLYFLWILAALCVVGWFIASILADSRAKDAEREQRYHGYYR